MSSSPDSLVFSKLSISTEQPDASKKVIGTVSPSETTAIPLSRLITFTQANIIVRKYLSEEEPVFRALDGLREKGWNSTEGDNHFQSLRRNADTADEHTQQRFYNMNKVIGEQLQDAGCFCIPQLDTPKLKALNLCIAPGGYTWSLLQAYPDASISGITLPVELGGHAMRLPHGDEDPRVQVKYMDLTMLVQEFGTCALEIPPQHPDAMAFSTERPYLGEAFDIVICDGQVLRLHERAGYRQNREGDRLNVAQLILAMARIKPGGTLIMLLHKADAFDTIQILQEFDSFSKITLFKPPRIHAARSSFYLVAKDVQPEHPQAQDAVQKWKDDWSQWTLGGVEGTGVDREMPSEPEVNAVLDAFGPKLIELARGVWSIQINALARASYTK